MLFGDGGGEHVDRGPTKLRGSAGSRQQSVGVSSLEKALRQLGSEGEFPALRQALWRRREMPIRTSVSRPTTSKGV